MGAPARSSKLMCTKAFAAKLLQQKRWAFQVQLAPSGGIEFAPGEFAAESEAIRDRRSEEFNALGIRGFGFSVCGTSGDAAFLVMCSRFPRLSKIGVRTLSYVTFLGY